MLATQDDLEGYLWAWGRIYGEKPPADDGDEIERLRLTGSAANTHHPLARALQFAPGKRRKRDSLADGRAGYDRRRMMGVAAGVRILAQGFVDPIPCVETRRSVYGSGETDRPVPVELQRIERAALDLLALDYERGLVLRTHYCTRGNIEEKASTVTMKINRPYGTRMYREALAAGRFWVWARLVP